MNTKEREVIALQGQLRAYSIMRDGVNDQIELIEAEIEKLEAPELTEAQQVQLERQLCPNGGCTDE